MSKPIFYDPQQKRWGRLRRLLNLLGIVVTGLIVFFIVNVFFGAEKLPDLQLLPGPRQHLRALKEKERARKPRTKSAHRRTSASPSQVVLNTDEGIRAAYYVTWDAASFVSLKEYYPLIDLLFPEWLHVLRADGSLEGAGADETNGLVPVVHDGVVNHVDSRVMSFLKSEKANVEVFPLINNFDPNQRKWLSSVGAFLQDPSARQNFRNQLLAFLATDRYKGATIDFEEIPFKAQPGFRALISELGQDLHARGLKLYVNVPVGNEDFDFRQLADASDGLIIMNYDQHHQESAPGPIAGQGWFTANLKLALKTIDKTKIICAIGNYGYDWATSKKGKVVSVEDNNVQTSWLYASESDSDIDFDPDSLNPHFAYEDDSGLRHHVWFLDGVTALNQMRAARKVGIRTFALWRLGSEDRSLWAVWDNPAEANAEQKLHSVPYGQDIDMEGPGGEILRIEKEPSPGTRETALDLDTGMFSETMTVLPEPYQLSQSGARAGKVAITFDDGPDPAATPKILDILKQKNVTATFFLIGMQAQRYPGLVRRIYDEGHIIGNHTFTHPDISDVSSLYLRKIELELTERLFASKLGVNPRFFRPPYSIDEDPDVADQVRPLEVVQSMGLIIVGSKIDPTDWERGRTVEDIVSAVHAQAQAAATAGCDDRPPLFCGSVILLHDGGGDRRATVQALPRIIDDLRASGFEIVSTSELAGVSRDEAMVRLKPNQIWAARLDNASFTMYAWIQFLVMLVFFAGDLLMSGRLLGIGTLAIFDRARTPPTAPPDYKPAVTVIIPAFNEEKVIEHTVRSVLDSDYPRLRTIVVDDGSKDATAAVVRQKFAADIAQGRVLVLTKPNGGKADSLNYGLRHTDDEIYVGIDADTVIAPNAISFLVPHFADPEVGAVAGNAKVGNRVNLWTRWQALEYISSQNFERRALNVFGAVSVVPGAIGAWRTSAVSAAGGYPLDTVAEDADLTMSLLEQGHRVINEDRALAFTEAPTTANGLMRQRFRWSFGILQAVWKHRAAIGKSKRLGWIALPNIVIFQIVLPLFSPSIDLMFVFGTLNYLAARYFHPVAADPSNFERLLFFFVIFLVIDFVAAALAFLLERRHEGEREDMWLLLHIWLQRFAYRQLFSAVLLRTLKRAIDGKPFAWDKLERTAAVAQSHA